MIKIQKFVLDRNKSIEILNSELKKFIKDFISKKDINDILNFFHRIQVSLKNP